MEASDDDSSDDGFVKIYAPLPSIVPSSNGASSSSMQVAQAVSEVSTGEFKNQVSQAVMDSVLRRSRLAVTLPWDKQVSGFPWEVGPFGFVFGSSNHFDAMFTIPRQAPIDTSQVDPIPVQTFLRKATSQGLVSVLRRIPRVPWPETQLAARHKALLRMRLVVEENAECTNVGRQLQEAIVRMEPDASLTNIISDSFENKATSTLCKRGSHLLKYFVWHRRFCGIAAMPIQEHHFYTYLRQLITAKAAPTAPAAMSSAMGFAAHVLGMTGAAEALASLRVKGLVQKHYLTKAPKKQSKVLTVMMVLALEDMITTAEDPVDRLAAGEFADQLHSRSRHMDRQLSELLIEDFDAQGIGYVECQSRFVKTSVTMLQKSMLMPLVAPSLGIHPDPWAPRWLAERRAQGVDLTRFGCMLPTPGADGKWHDVPVSSSAASAWLRELLSKAGFKQEELDGISTHSLKATPLSWCAKHQVDLPTRQLLGHHVTSDKVSALTYSRDAQAQPLRAYELELKSIREKQFFPDKTRSGMWNDPLDDASNIKRLKRSELVSEPAVKDPEQQDTVSSSDSSSSDSSGSEDDLEAVKVLDKRQRNEFALLDGSMLYVHRRSNVVHLRIGLNVNKLVCNRAISMSYLKKDAEACSICLKCLQCFGRK